MKYTYLKNLEYIHYENQKYIMMKCGLPDLHPAILNFWKERSKLGPDGSNTFRAIFYNYFCLKYPKIISILNKTLSKKGNHFYTDYDVCDWVLNNCYDLEKDDFTEPIEVILAGILL
jgi:hypothetical protein